MAQRAWRLRPKALAAPWPRIEPEMAFANLKDDMDCAEAYIRLGACGNVAISAWAAGTACPPCWRNAAQTWTSSI